MEEARSVWAVGEDDDMRDVEAAVLAAERSAGEGSLGSLGSMGSMGSMGSLGVPGEDKSSSEGGSSVAGDQSDADATRMSDEQSDERGASRSRFKTEQALSIRTANSPDDCRDEQAAASGETKGSSAATPASQSASTVISAKPGEKKGKAATGAATPSSGKKRRRRTAAQIDRKYKCNFPGCSKAYGSEGSLTQHQRLKFHKPRDESRVANRKSPNVEKPFLPLHRSPSSHLKAGSFLLPTSASVPPPGVSIRPATMGGMPGSPYHATSPSPSVVCGKSGAASTTNRSNLLDYAYEASEAQHRSNNLRSRSNSMPISFTIPSPAQMQQAPGSGPRASTRKPRVSSTPRAKPTTARRAKSRSKSESLSGFVNFAELDGMVPPRSDRSISDSTASTHESVISFEGADAQPMRASWSAADVTMSMEDQAIDSDILSVLANCDASELGVDDPVPLVQATSPAAPATFHSRTFGPMGDQDMLPAGFECFNIVEGVPALAAVGSLKQESYRDGHSLQHEVGNEHAVGARVGAGSLFSTPGADVKEEPPITAIDPLTGSFDIPMFDPHAENNMHSLSQLNSFSGGVSSGLPHVDGVNRIQVFKAETPSAVKYHDPGTPLQGIPAKLGRLNIDNSAGWRDVTSILNEPDSEEQLPQDPQQPQLLAQPQGQLTWTKGAELGSAFSSNNVDHAQLPALRTSNVAMDWHTASKIATSSSSMFFQTPDLYSETTMSGFFGDFLMSEASLDSRMPAQVLGQDDDLL